MLSIYRREVPNESVAKLLLNDLDTPPPKPRRRARSGTLIGKSTKRKTTKGNGPQRSRWPLFLLSPFEKRRMLLRFVLASTTISIDRLSDADVSRLWDKHKDAFTAFLDREREPLPTPTFDIACEIARWLDPITLVRMGRCCKLYKLAFDRVHREVFDAMDPKLLLYAVVRPSKKQWEEREAMVYSPIADGPELLLFDEEQISLMICRRMESTHPGTGRHRVIMEWLERFLRADEVNAELMPSVNLTKALTMNPAKYLARGVRPADLIAPELCTGTMKNIPLGNSLVTSLQDLEDEFERMRPELIKFKRPTISVTDMEQRLIYMMQNTNMTPELMEKVCATGTTIPIYMFVFHHRNATLRFLLRHSSHPMIQAWWRMKCL